MMPSASRRFRQGLLVSLFNPKPIVFFMALFPQFIHPAALYSAVQRAVDNLLSSGGGIHSLYGLFAHT
jgi:threonine/homoserine/homoserine lactone efflux protein